MSKRASKPVRGCDDRNRFPERIKDLSKQARELRGVDLDYIDQIPDSKIVDEPIPFPYGGGRKFDTWNLK